MQTFLPYGTDMQRNAACLDRQRLGKQRVEAYQILKTLLGESAGWANHPATRMWQGYEDILACYTLTICKRWTDLGYQDTVADKVCGLMLEVPFRHPNYRFNVDLWRFEQFFPRHSQWVTVAYPIQGVHTPVWMDDPRFRHSHRSNLVHKFPEHYGMIWPEYLNTPRMEYVWPDPDCEPYSIRWGVPSKKPV